MGRGKATIVLISERVWARVDVVRGERPTLGEVSRVEPEAEVESLGFRVELVLERSGGKPAGPVWVLTDAAWTQTLELPSEVAGRLSGEERQQALAFEVEPLSGVPGVESAMGFRSLSERESGPGFWLSQISSYDREEIESSVSAAGGKLAGVLHPAGVAAWGLVQAGEAKGVVSCWSQAVACVASPGTGSNGQGGQSVSAGSGGPRVLVLPEAGMSTSWRVEADRFFAEQGLSGGPELWLDGLGGLELPDAGPDAEPQGKRAPTAWRLTEPQGLQGWLEQAAAVLCGQKDPGPSVPVVPVPRRPLSGSQRAMIAAGLAAAMALVCYGHHTLLGRQAASLEVQTETLREPIAELQELNEAESSLTEELSELRSEVADLQERVQRTEASLAAHRQRFAALLDVVARTRPQGLWLQEVSGVSDGVALRGLCADPGLVNRWASALQGPLGPLGWRAQIPEKAVEGRLWRYELTLRDTDPTVTQGDAGPSVARGETATREVNR